MEDVLLSDDEEMDTFDEDTEEDANDYLPTKYSVDKDNEVYRIQSCESPTTAKH